MQFHSVKVLAWSQCVVDAQRQAHGNALTVINDDFVLRFMLLRLRGLQ
jgi:hypothetical protein